MFNIPLFKYRRRAAELGNFVLTGGGTLSGTASAASGTLLEFGSNFTIIDGAQFAGPGAGAIR